MTTAPKITGFSRRALLAARVAAMALAQTANASPAVSSLASDVERYVDLGVHRAGGRGEARTVRWLKKRLQALGYAARLDAFPVRTLASADGRLKLGAEILRVFPQWLPPESALGGTISAPIRALEAPGDEPAIRFIAEPIANTPYWTDAQNAWVQEAVAKRALALVVAIANPSGGLYACNRDVRAPALTLPVAQIAGNDLPRLSAAANSSGLIAKLRLEGKMADRQSFNVIGEKPGRGRTLVLSTPLTGWFHCGGERGPGIALWLRMAAVLAKQERPVLLLGTGAHEIGQLGMAEALKAVAPKPEDTAFWIHFGASTAATRLDAAYGVTSPQYLVATDDTAAAVREALLAHAPVFVIGNAKTAGEAGQVLGAGHRNFAALSGHFPAFHTPDDKGEAVDYAALERVAAAAASLIARMAALPDPVRPA